MRHRFLFSFFWCDDDFRTQFAGVKTEAPCNFDNLGWLVGISHCLLPLLAIPLTFILIPNKLMTEMIIEDEASEPTLLQGALGKDEGRYIIRKLTFCE